MTNWIFQGNPDYFDFDKYVSSDKFSWSVRQNSKKISIGDWVFIWRSAGKDKHVSGVIAIAEITSEIYFDKELNEKRVYLKVIHRCSSKKQLVKTDWIKEDPILRGLNILRMRSNTNYLIHPNEAERLKELCINSGIDWTREECIAALSAYSETLGGKISMLPDSPVSNTALIIGRAVSGVYNKLMNFRAIDPTDSRAGLPSTSTEDIQVWNEFYDVSENKLNVLRLKAEYDKIWNKTTRTHTKTVYADFGEAPDDDPEQLSNFAARVRKGQPKFRKKLLKLYDNKCAITGWGPEAVLEASHIVEHSKSGLNKSNNGILLRADFHSLMDSNLLWIDDDFKIHLDASLEGTDYWSYNNDLLRKRIDGTQPSKELMKQRWSSKY